MELNENSDYLIYSNGNIYNKKTKRYLKICYSKSRGQTAIRVNGKMKSLYPHRLVAEYYIPNPNKYKEVDHIDRNVHNNDISNLRWADRFIQNQNRNNNKNNKSGHRCIMYLNHSKSWKVKKTINGKSYARKFKNKIDAMCYKYILLLKINSNYYVNNGI